MILVVGGEKGGTGKTTLATSIASILAKKGRDVLLVDADPQRTASHWASFRSQNESKDIPKFSCVEKLGQGLPKDILQLSKKYQDIVIDTGGRDTVELRSSMAIADLIVIPVKPGAAEIWTIPKMAELLSLVSAINPKLQNVVVVTMASTHANAKDFSVVRETMSDFKGLKLSNRFIKSRSEYANCTADGICVTESGKDEKAKFEMMAFFEEEITPMLNGAINE